MARWCGGMGDSYLWEGSMFVFQSNSVGEEGEWKRVGRENEKEEGRLGGRNVPLQERGEKKDMLGGRRRR